jgi:hypothetical protein
VRSAVSIDFFKATSVGGLFIESERLGPPSGSLAKALCRVWEGPLVSPASDGCEEPVNPDRRMEGRRVGAGAVVAQCTFIQITTAITPKDPTTVRTTRQRSKKSI